MWKHHGGAVIAVLQRYTRDQIMTTVASNGDSSMRSLRVVGLITIMVAQFGAVGTIYAATRQVTPVSIEVDVGFDLEFREVLRIGSLEGESDAFGRISGARFGSNGTIYVGDDLNHHVAIYAADGTLIQRVGRQGRGPGEFVRPWRISVDPYDTLFIWDQALKRVSIFDPALEFVRSFTLMRNWFPSSWFVLPGDTIIVAAAEVSDSTGLHLLDREGGFIRSIAHMYVDASVYRGFTSSLFGGSVDLRNDQLVYAQKSPYEVTWLNLDGQANARCRGDDSWTTDPRKAFSQSPERVTIHWETYTHVTGVYFLDAERVLVSVVQATEKSRRILYHVLTRDCKVVAQLAADEFEFPKDKRGNRILITRTDEYPEVIVYEIAVRRR